jgi:hypothetical protein
MATTFLIEDATKACLSAVVFGQANRLFLLNRKIFGEQFILNFKSKDPTWGFDRGST